MIHACGANAQHGMPRTRKDLQRAIKLLLDDPELKLLSDRRLAALANCTDKTVAAVRKEHGDDGKRTYTDRWGNVSEMDTQNIGPHKGGDVPAFAEHLVTLKDHFESACKKAESFGELKQLQDALAELVKMIDKARKRLEKAIGKAQAQTPAEDA